MNRPAPDPRGLQRLQRAAGNAAVSRLVAQRYTAPVKPSPAHAPGFRRVKADVAAKKTRLAVHAPAAAESKSAQDAAVAPPDDKEAQGKAANAEKMNAAKPGEFDKQAFVDAVNKAINAQAPSRARGAEAQQLSTAKAGAAAAGTQAMTALTATRSAAGKQVDGGKGETKSKDEKRRAEVTAKLQKVYDATKKDVEETLSGLDKKVDAAFTAGEKAARDMDSSDPTTYTKVRDRSAFDSVGISHTSTAFRCPRPPAGN
ncbi:hypothetical protein ACFYYY_19665 [Streptomyces sp. NPDC001834]|uniref:hypothetical protein n=1 Tax=Streptomyces sp. NPDC001834 TaxID=3364616 RepID=UPI0036C5680C